MNNTETIIKELEDAITEATYPDRPRKFMMSLELAEKVLVLLKEQQLFSRNPKLNCASS